MWPERNTEPEEEVVEPEEGVIELEEVEEEIDDLELEAEILEEQPQVVEAAPKARKAGPSRYAFKKGADKAIEVMEARESTRDLVAALMRLDNPTVSALTVAILTTPKSAIRPLTLLEEWLEMDDDFETLVAVIDSGTPMIRGVWALLVSLGTLSGKPPVSDTKAGREIVKSLSLVDNDTRTQLSACAALLGK